MAVGFGLSARAQDPEPMDADDMSWQVVATDNPVVAVDDVNRTFTVETDDGRLLTIAADEDTRIHADEDPLSFSDLRVGDEVTVRIKPQEAAAAPPPPAAPLEPEPVFEDDEYAAELPSTASPLALFALAGGALLGSGLVLRGSTRTRD